MERVITLECIVDGTGDKGIELLVGAMADATVALLVAPCADCHATVEAKTRNGTSGGTAERGDGTASNC